MTALLISFDPAKPPLFPLGELFATADVITAVPQEEITAALARHASGDWGDLDRDDQVANRQALETGGRLLSNYTSKSGTPFWIVTEAATFATTVSLPEEN
jgi:hypothetical protein